MIETFDLERWLQDKGIDYRREGKNVTEGWTEVNCPFCTDPSFHLGISPTMQLSCWICGPHGSIINYIQEIERCSFNFAQKIIEKYQDRTLKSLTQKERLSSSSVVLPKTAKSLDKIHKSYLIKRGFDPEYLERKYDLLGCKESGDFKFRIIVPVYFQNKLMTFIGRDVTGKQDRYKNLSVEKSVLPVKSCVYNIDSVKDTTLIVEGVTDVWRMGEGSVALFGTKYTKKQLTYFAGLKRIFVLFDEDASEQALKLGHDLGVLVGEVNVLSIGCSYDPADLTEDDAKMIRREIGLL